MFTFESFPMLLIIALIIAAWASFLSVVPWGNLF